MIVDAHAHIVEPGVGPAAPRAASADDLVREMDECGVDVSVIIPLPGVASNDFVHREAARFPSRLVALYCPDFTGGDATRPLEAFLERHDVRGLKIHPRVQQVTVEDQPVVEVLAWAAEHRMPVVFDAFPWGPFVDDPRIHPLAYARVARRFPDLKLVLAHAGGYKAIEAFVVAKAHANVRLDVSFTFDYYRGASVERDLAFVCGRLPEGRVLYGSDFPHVGLGEYLQLARANLDTLREEQRRALFGDAAGELFGLK